MKSDLGRPKLGWFRVLRPLLTTALRASTTALASQSRRDARYTRLENALAGLGTQRDALAGRMRAILLGAAFAGRHVPPGLARKLISEGEQLLGKAALLAR